MNKARKSQGEPSETYYLGIRISEKPELKGSCPYAKEVSSGVWYQLIEKCRGSLSKALAVQDESERFNVENDDMPDTPTTILKEHPTQLPDPQLYRLVEHIPIREVDAALKKRKNRGQRNAELQTKIRNLINP